MKTAFETLKLLKKTDQDIDLAAFVDDQQAHIHMTRVHPSRHERPAATYALRTTSAPLSGTRMRHRTDAAARCAANERCGSSTDGGRDQPSGRDDGPTPGMASKPRLASRPPTPAAVTMPASLASLPPRRIDRRRTRPISKRRRELFGPRGPTGAGTRTGLSEGVPPMLQAATSEAAVPSPLDFRKRRRAA